VAELITALLTYGPLGIISGILLKMYLEEKKQAVEKIEALNKTIQDLLKRHSETLQNISAAQNDREKEVNLMLKDYGKSVVDALDQAHALAERLWSIRK
jgi:hypothetical protein